MKAYADLSSAQRIKEVTVSGGGRSCSHESTPLLMQIPDSIHFFSIQPGAGHTFHSCPHKQEEEVIKHNWKERCSMPRSCPLETTQQHPREVIYTGAVRISRELLAPPQIIRLLTLISVLEPAQLVLPSAPFRAVTSLWHQTLLSSARWPFLC